MSDPRFYFDKKQGDKKQGNMKQGKKQANAKSTQNKVILPSSYLMPYRRKEDGVTEVLIGQKKVICYQAQEKFERGLTNSDIIKDVMETGKGWSNAYDTRFNGLFFYAGGKQTCLGGRAKLNDKYMDSAAIREFLEETGIERLLKKNPQARKELVEKMEQNLDLIYETDISGFKGFYYAINVNACPTLGEYLTDDKIAQENEAIKKDEQTSELSLQKRINAKLSDRMSEMHALKWVKLTELEKALDHIYAHVGSDNYIKEEIDRGFNLLTGLFNLNRNDSKLKTFRNKLGKKIKEEITNGNVSAATELVKQLSPKPDVKEQEEMGNKTEEIKESAEIKPR